ncbi:uncharacterized protein [Asterias amurensis]|uniref:uncharacterized protein isoform X2 n=1 Tax=Asterias amurensis TaxID=7602 RepID=UPI003AB667DD
MNKVTILLSAILAIKTKVHGLTRCKNNEDIETFYCIRSSREAKSQFLFYDGPDRDTNEFDFCLDYQFFDYGIDPNKRKPKGCTKCPDGTHIGKSNFCPFCFPCVQEDELNGNETESIVCVVDNKSECGVTFETSTAPSGTDGKTDPVLVAVLACFLVVMTGVAIVLYRKRKRTSS